jgi:hypothetical protein
MKTYPDDEPEKFDLIEQSLVVAQETLTEEEFSEYTKLIKELVELKTLLQKEKREPSGKEARRSNEIGTLMRPYENKFMPIFAEQLASFPLTEKPTYIPDEYKLTQETYGITNIGEEPVVSFDYRKGESWFNTQQLKINQLTDLEKPEAGLFENPVSYTLNGFQFEFVSKEQSAVAWWYEGNSARERVKMVLVATDLSKEGM